MTLADALPEMLKPFVARVETSRTLPTRYTFVAPRIHPRLVDTVLTPQDLKKQFQAYLGRRPAPVQKLKPEVLAAVQELAEAEDFTWFWTVNLGTMLEVDRDTPLFVERFNLPPTGKPAKRIVPDEPDESLEARFLEQLLQVYMEYFGEHIYAFADAFAHVDAGLHLRRQRDPTP